MKTLSHTLLLLPCALFLLASSCLIYKHEPVECKLAAREVLDLQRHVRPCTSLECKQTIYEEKTSVAIEACRQAAFK